MKIKECLLAVLLVQGCTSADLPTGECVNDVDCVAGLKCYDARFCVAATVPETPVVVRVLPPADSGFVAEQFKVTLTGDSQNEARKLVLTEPAVVRGTVTRLQTPTVGTVSGTLLATAPGDIEGRELSFQATVYEGYKTFPGATEAQNYELRVQKGNTYTLAFWPTDETIPPHYSTLTVGDSIERWDLKLPPESELKTLSGQLLAGKTPIPGMRVWLHDAQGRLWSTRGKTDANGRYSFRVDPSAPRSRLVFAPETDAAANLAARLPSGELALPIDVTSVSGDLPTIQLGPLPAVVTSRLHVLGPDGQPIAGALVRMQVNLTDLPGTATLTGLQIAVVAMTDASGVAVLEAPAAVGDLTVTPPPKSTAARLFAPQTRLTVGESAVTMSARVHVTGRVKDYASRSVPGVEVTLRQVATEDAPGTTAPDDETHFTVDPDADGNFALWVDPGEYAVWIDPPEGASLARVWQRYNTKDAPWFLNFSPPMVLAGEVLSQAGDPVPGVQIDVLAVKVQATATGRVGPDPNQLGKTPSGTVVLDSHLLGSTLSTLTGQFEVLVAPGQVAAQKE